VSDSFGADTTRKRVNNSTLLKFLFLEVVCLVCYSVFTDRKI